MANGSIPNHSLLEELEQAHGQLVGLAGLLERLQQGQHLTPAEWHSAISSTWESIVDARKALIASGSKLETMLRPTPPEYTQGRPDVV